ncbi:hypothetical protein ACFWB2_30475 [Streptomyces virginiae]|uniref:Uncharacterized protein n=2 Tax=Streptomyces TaxID=1883 RepID=A0ABZ1THK0_STRVG|nr:MULTISPECIES: hypothetical protein [Streptomyces]MCM9079407.1 hypothetical protein [Streptomyces spororaveus]MCX4719308.1 hypothetical protein [Streptomyces virginiae]MCX5271239.1 hypothetical protein [Streptomyces virginiae]MCX5306177.1 hypothetical protein [Streptomyces sp. NBC_00160]MYV76858.1 hypothetical protein [Streptomyces sp. SID1046]
MPTGGTLPTDHQAHALVDALWAHATPDCGMEHIRARTHPDGIGIVLFIRAARTDIAQAKVRRLVVDTLASGGTGVHGYSVTFHP